jgi:signal transduction histidine kinase/ActR/RegA family two-component response regulator/HPt (histidine-containing phosphotransfer) domain-containing protein
MGAARRPGFLGSLLRPVDRYVPATTFMILGALALVFLVGVVAILMTLREREAKVEFSFREDALWATYKLEQETATLLSVFGDALDHAVSPAPAELERSALLFDVLYSRVKTLRAGGYETSFLRSDTTRQDFRRLAAAVLDAAPLFDRIAAGAPVSVDEMRGVLRTFDRLRQITADLLLYANIRVNEMRSDMRVGTQRLYEALAFAVFFLTATLVGTVALLGRQVRAEMRSRLEIAAMAKSVQEAAEAAEAGNRAKSAFLATIGHEIRTPLNGILGMAAALQASKLDPDQARCLDVVNDCGASLMELINDILDYAKFEAGEFPVSEVAFEPAEVVRSVFSVVEDRASKRGNTLEFEIDPGTAPAFLADPSRLRQVLLNLVGNAVKFTENGRILVRVSATTGAAARLRFEVQDNGIGIAPEARHRVFKPFSQVDATINRKFGGTGLGLSICRSVVNKLGGEIDFASTPGRGSSFWFEVPVRVVEPPKRASAEATDGPRPLRPSRLLVVEDNRVNQEVARRLLEALGQSVVLADDGQAGIDRARSERFDLILMDMQMPGIDGLQATREIRRSPGACAGVPILALTANASEQDRLDCLAAGMTGYLTKPLSIAQLIGGLAQHLGHAGVDEPAGAGEPAEAGDAAGEPAILDEVRRDELVAAIGQDGFRDLVQGFLPDAERLVRELEAAVAAGDGPAIDRLLHTLRGSALNVGYAAFAALAEKAKASDLTQAPERLRRSLERARAAEVLG